MSIEETLAVAQAIHQTQNRLRTLVSAERARATYRYQIGLRKESAGWAQREDGAVRYALHQTIALTPTRDIAFEVSMTFARDAYSVTRSAVDSVETDEGYDEVELLAEKRVEALTVEQFAAALSAAVDDIAGMGDYLDRLDPPLPPKTASK